MNPPLNRFPTPDAQQSDCASLPRRGLLTAIAAAAILPARMAGAQPKPWPNRAIQLLVPAPAGGGVDLTARQLAEGLGTALDTTVVVNNRPGAAGLLTAQTLATAAPDGYTVGYLHSGHIVLQAMEGKPNMLTEFTPITLISASQFCVAVNVDSPYRTMAELIAAIEKSPGKLNYGAGGNGSPGHIAWEKIVSMRPGLNAVQIPFKGAAESTLAVAQKEIDFVCGLFSSVLAMVRSGRLRVLAVTAAQRSPLLPDVPAVAQVPGFAGYAHVSWGALCGPAKLPTDVTTKLFDATRKVAQSASFGKFIDENGGHVVVSDSPAALAAMIKAELTETTALLARLGLRKT